MNKLKVMTVVGTRPEIIRLSRVIPTLDNFCDHTLVHTGQNYDYELNEIFFTDLGIRRPDYFLEAAGKNSIETIGNILIAIDKTLDIVKPEAVLILGDTNSCMAVLPAKRRKIPTFHMEAGNRCFDMRVPEEINRRIIDHTADINLPYSTIAREYLLREGLPPDQIIKTGSPMFEVITYYRPLIDKSDILEKLDLKKGKFFLVSAHREENLDLDEKVYDLVQLMNHINDRYGFPIIFSTHPRTKKRFEQLNIKLNNNLRLLSPLSFSDYCKLQLSAKVVLSDSGTISEESSILNFPAINIREAHERPEAMEQAAVMMCGFNTERVSQAIEILENDINVQSKSVADYSVENVSEKVVKIIISYTDYVNRVVWRDH